MATGSVSMLGISTSGQTALNADLIDKLKEADKSIMIKPIETKLTKVYERQSDQEKLETKLSEFMDTVEIFSDEQNYLKREVKSNSESVSVSADSGTALQDFTLKVNELATNSVQQTKAFKQEDTIIYAGVDPVIMKISQANGRSFDIKVEGGTTLSELRDKINEASNGSVVASILNVGGEDPYKLIIKSNATGAKEEIIVSYQDTDGNDMSGALDLEMDSIQSAKNAKFEYNGIAIERATNKVSDLISGVNIELRKVDTVEAHITVSQNTSALKDKMGEFVEKYNDLMKMINEITKYDVDTNASGSFQGDSRITGIKTALNRILFGKNEEGKTIMDLTRVRTNLDGTTSGAFAFSLGENGLLTFDKTTFDYALDADPAGVERLFRGITDITPTEVVGKTLVPNSTDDIVIASGGIKINGVSLAELTFEAGSTAEQNAQKAIDAINALKDQTGVSAKLSSNKQGIILFDSTGNGFTISGDESSKLGLNNGSFSGSSETKGGIFTALADQVNKINGFASDSIMSLISTQLKSEVTNSTDSIQSILNRINAKYQVMAMQFSAYNAMISQYESSFASIQMQIDQAAARK